MPASIIVNQVTLSAGVAGTARSDGVIGQLVTCSNATVEASYVWTLVDVPIRSALTRGTVSVASTFPFTPDVKGTYLVTLRVNGSVADADNAETYLAVRSFGSKALSWRYKAASETTSDNETYAGLGFPSNVNPRGWATDEDLVYEEVEESVWETQNASTAYSGLVERVVKTNPATGQVDISLIAGTAPTGSAGGDLSGTYPNPSVVRLRGRAISNPFTPSDGQVFWWNGTSSQFELSSDVLVQSTGASVALQDGTLGALALRFKADPDTGMYRSAANRLSLVTGGASALLLSNALVAAAGTDLGAFFQFTVNKVAGDYTALRVDVIETLAPGTDDRVFDFRVGGSSMIYGSNTGNLFATDRYGWVSDPDTFIRSNLADTVDVVVGNGLSLRFTSGITTLYTDLLPSIDVTYNLGSAGLRWNDVYANSVVSAAASTFADGIVTAPGIAFTAEPGTGAWRSPTNSELAFSSNGVEVARFQAPSGIDPQVLVAAGSATKPSFAFTGDPDTGFASGGGNILGFIAGGTQRMYMSVAALNATINIAPTINNTYDLGISARSWKDLFITRVCAGTGTAATPSISSNTFPSSGMYWTPETVNLTTGGSRVATFNSLLNNAAGDEIVADFAGAVNKVAGNYTGIRLNVTETAAPGTDDRLLDLQVGGSSQFLVDNSGSVQAGAGSAAAPGYRWTADGNTGMWWPGSDQLGFSTGGTNRLTISTTEITPEVVYRGISGSAGSPAMSFAIDPDTGIYRSGINTLSISAGTTEALRASATQILSVSGSAALPTYSFIANPDTGMWTDGTYLGFSVGGAQKLEVTTTSLVPVGGVGTMSLGGSSAPFYQVVHQETVLIDLVNGESSDITTVETVSSTTGTTVQAGSVIALKHDRAMILEVRAVAIAQGDSSESLAEHVAWRVSSDGAGAITIASPTQMFRSNTSGLPKSVVVLSSPGAEAVAVEVQNDPTEPDLNWSLTITRRQVLA